MAAIDIAPGGVTLDVVEGNIAQITLNRPEVRNAQNKALLYALDNAFREFAQNDDLSVAILRGAGKHFSAGHDLGSSEVDYDVSYPSTSMWWDHVGKDGVENWLALEEELFLGFSRRWREIPKPTIAAVQGACVAGGLMLAWPCDLIVASEDAFFSDPVLMMGIGGVELFAHPWELGPRQAKEMLFMAEPVPAQRAYELGMVNRVVPRDELDSIALSMARQIARMPRMGLVLAKKAVNAAEDAMGYRQGTEQAFAWHQLAQAHNALISGGPGRGHDAKSMKSRETAGPGAPWAPAAG
jgi:enoyl-CoA hydratase